MRCDKTALEPWRKELQSTTRQNYRLLMRLILNESMQYDASHRYGSATAPFDPALTGMSVPTVDSK